MTYFQDCTSGLVIAISRGQREELAFVQIVKAQGELEDREMLEGKVLMGVGGMPNGFSTHAKNFLTSDAAFIRSPPLFFKIWISHDGGKKINILEIEENEFRSLANKFLL